ncbi:hypothetical protein BZA05DRAFT_392841 [Tricharina praecox]|uniref:uncharacterized protein n=1 Tax=Tricharina praecox TaxID=43433 RepID=UPI00221EA9E1|nr:uncharacterized protein BZA05DRAFT_392841 [Tricharina praecox]KAI5854877.1 hypothetical protein BZA05DRAFT_392841 [Tricharina praecox]
MANYQELRARTLGSTQEEEAVTVNTRALIDKVLARYSSENTTLRELIQNAADAGATSVEVRYTTDVEDHSGEAGDDLLRTVKGKVKRLVVKNDGDAFREEDWQRLKRIAEGNPDEEKIGAFGVGFYSVFADTDDPFVSSGNQTMAFYWKGNSLFTRRATMDKVDRFTTFYLDYREPGELPELRTLCQFFSTSLTFVNLAKISLYINDIQMLVLNKKVLPPAILTIPKTINTITKETIMKIEGVKTSNVQIDAKYMNVTYYKPEKPAEVTVTGFARMLLFGRSETPAANGHVNMSNLAEYTSVSIFLRIATATVLPKVGKKFAQELERATKKPPPKKTTISCLTMSKDEQDASQSDSEIFAGVIPTKSGRIFIGFPTHQTTGINAHIAAHSVIPTVERENIDLNAKIIKAWNAEMLRAAGILARILYWDEMDMLRKRADGLKAADLVQMYDQAIHILQQFTFKDSTPSVHVGDYIREGFWNCSLSSIELLSTRGVLPSSKVRLANEVTFLEGLAFLPAKIVKGAPEFVHTLERGGYITEITFHDIQNSLAEKPLGSEQSHAFLKWLSHQLETGKKDDLQASMLLSGAIAMVPFTNEKGEVVENGLPVSLGDVKYYVNANKLPPDVPLPPHCLPFALTKRLLVPELERLTWRELPVVDWVYYVAGQASTLPVEQNLELSPAFANTVLGIVSKNWDKLSVSEKAQMVEALKDKTCIPTRQGMKMPREAYFPTVKLFADLPIIHEVRNVKEKFLAALGLRKTVELKLVFERLMGGGTAAKGEKWSHVDLVRYLTSVAEDIPQEDIRKLCNMEMCKAEPADSTKMYKVSELYEPQAKMRELGLPVLQWPGEWRNGSKEAAFLLKLGLRKYPAEETIIRLAASADKKLREKAMRYFTDYFHDNDYNTNYISITPVSFLPLQNDSEKLVRPTECYANSECGIMGYNVLRSDLQQHASKFGVRKDPDIKECSARLKRHPPVGPKDAKEKFSYFANRMMELTVSLSTELGSSSIVPVKGETGFRHIPPRICYIGGDSSKKYGDIFDFVDFGTAANAFLMKCGSKPEPTTVEVAYRLAMEPDRLYKVFRSETRYLSMLTTIAYDWSILKKDKELVRALKASPCLAAYRSISLNGEKVSAQPADEEEEGMREFVLLRAEDIYLIDDISNYHLFKTEVCVAPEEDTLEKFYTALGSTTLSSNIDKRVVLGNNLPQTKKINDLQQLVMERARLFMHSNNEGVSRDAGWLENNLIIQGVEFIRYKMTFRHKEGPKTSRDVNRTAAVVNTPDKSVGKSHTLFVTQKMEYYDIALALVRLILQKPKPHSALLFESLLSNDLMTLKRRGYNVGRILAKKQAEAQLMEQARLKQVEAQRKGLEEQERRFQEEQKSLSMQQQQQQISVKDRALMPGGFQDDSPPHPFTQKPAGEAGSFFSRNMNRFSKLLQEQQQQQQPQIQSSEPSKERETRVVNQQHKATEHHRLAANLQQAIQSGRDHASQSLFAPPKTFDVKEVGTFCDSNPGQDIEYAIQTPTGMRVYVHKSLDQAQRRTFLSTNAAAINVFSLLLRSNADVFSMNPSVLHIFYDPTGSTIAFNMQGSIFCNVSFFLQLHAQQVPEKRWSADAFTYWWVTICHELAHNLVSEHGSNHSFYCESFVQEYFPKVMAKVAEIQNPPPPPPAYKS